MKKRGLNVIELDQSTLDSFRQTADQMNVSMRGAIVPSAVYDEAVRVRNEYRNR